MTILSFLKSNKTILAILSFIVATSGIIYLETQGIEPQQGYRSGEFTTSTDYKESNKDLKTSWNPSWDFGYENHGIGRSTGMTIYNEYGPSQTWLKVHILEGIQIITKNHTFHTYIALGIIAMQLALFFLIATLFKHHWQYNALFPAIIHILFIQGSYFTDLRVLGTWYPIAFACIIAIIPIIHRIILKKQAWNWLLLALTAVWMFGPGINTVIIYALITTSYSAYLLWQQKKGFQKSITQWLLINGAIVTAGIITNTKIYILELLFPKTQPTAWSGYLDPKGASFIKAFTLQNTDQNIATLIANNEWWAICFIFAILALIIINLFEKKKTVQEKYGQYITMTGLLLLMGVFSILGTIYYFAFKTLPILNMYRTTHRFSILIIIGLTILFITLLKKAITKKRNYYRIILAIVILLCIPKIISQGQIKNQQTIQDDNQAQYEKIAEVVEKSTKRTLLVPYKQEALLEKVYPSDIKEGTRPTDSESYYNSLIPTHGAITNGGRDSNSATILGMIESNLHNQPFGKMAQLWSLLGLEQIVVAKQHSEYIKKYQPFEGVIEQKNNHYGIINLETNGDNAHVQLNSEVQIVPTSLNTLLFDGVILNQESPLLFLEQNDSQALAGLKWSKQSQLWKSTQYTIGQEEKSKEREVSAETQIALNSINQEKEARSAKLHIPKTLQRLYDKTACSELRLVPTELQEQGIRTISSAPYFCPRGTTYSNDIWNVSHSEDEYSIYARIINTEKTEEKYVGITWEINEERKRASYAKQAPQPFQWINLGATTGDHTTINLHKNTEDLIVDGIILVTKEELEQKENIITTTIEKAINNKKGQILKKEVIQLAPEKAIINLEVTKPTLLTWKRQYTPHWQAVLENGEKIEPIIVNYAQTGFIIPEGKHTITITHKPATPYRIARHWDNLLLYLTLLSTLGTGIYLFFRKGKLITSISARARSLNKLTNKSNRK